MPLNTGLYAANKLSGNKGYRTEYKVYTFNVSNLDAGIGFGCMGVEHLGAPMYFPPVGRGFVARGVIHTPI